jgi:hypothetical protein
MEKRIRAFADILAGADVGLFYYAGHGLQVDGKNFLAPVDAELRSESDLDFEAVELDLVLKQMVRNVSTSIVFLDACRDNPLAAALAQRSRSINVGRGLARVEAPSSMMIVYATKDGSVAQDGSGRNSPFTAALLRHIDAEGVSISDMMIDVRNDVLKETGGNQRPFESASLTGKFFFKPPPAAAVDETAKNSDDIAALRAEIARLQTDQGALLKSQQEQLERLQAKLATETGSGPQPQSPAPAPPAASPAPPQATAAPSPAEETKTSAVESPAPQVQGPEATPPSTSPLPQSRKPEEIARDMLSELKRLDCYSGAVSARWGARPKLAVERFNRVSSLELPADEPLEASLETIKGWKGPNCPIENAATPSSKSRPAAAAPKKQSAPAPQRASKSPPPAPRAQAARPRANPDSGGSAEINELQRMFPEGAWTKPR